ncbi:zinc ribbon domain-containing protein [Streptomyces sp. NPDC018711]|uniref:zinc ribbon domain-containing protein n=1 Tax=Streptomyces sp. NPDC018711 TaxID=3365052 RepID=UPI0037ABB9CF
MAARRASSQHLVTRRLVTRYSHVALVDPARTFRTCNRCGHAGARSRRTRAPFTCTRCGHAARADIGAAINIRDRARQPADG